MHKQYFYINGRAASANRKMGTKKPGNAGLLLDAARITRRMMLPKTRDL